jgi:hypothetical protein
MAYKLVCVHEFFDDISGAMINRGDEIYDYTHIAQLVAANREHHFTKVFLAMADAYWEWPPTLPESPEEAAAKAAAAKAAAAAAEPEAEAAEPEAEAAEPEAEAAETAEAK